MHLGDLADTPVEVVRAVVDLNLTVALLVARRAVQDLGDGGIRVNGVAPGLVRTGIHAGAGDAGRLERVEARVPLGRAGEPEEVATAIAWLLSDACPYVTGATLRVAGGR